MAATHVAADLGNHNRPRRMFALLLAAVFLVHSRS